MNVYKVTFEVLYKPKDMQIPLFFHPAYIVEVKSVSKPEDESSIVRLEE